MNEDGTAGGRRADPGGRAKGGGGDAGRGAGRARRRGPGGPLDGNGGQGPNRVLERAARPARENGARRRTASAPTSGARARPRRRALASEPSAQRRTGAPRASRAAAASASSRSEAKPSEDQKAGSRASTAAAAAGPSAGAGAGTAARSAATTTAARRGRTGENWWARRWVEVLERFAVGRRLGRGRNYARQGHIVDIEIGKGFVTAHVQGSRDAPYLVRMHFSMLSSTDWKKLTRALAQRPDIAVELGMGQIPESIEQVFEEQRLSLFPNASGDLKAACSCPDNANPCKHVAAVYYLLGEEFDRDPFLIFQLRGMERSELLAALGPAAIPRAAGSPPPPPEPQPAATASGRRAARRGRARSCRRRSRVIEPPPERVIPDEPLPEDPGGVLGRRRAQPRRGDRGAHPAQARRDRGAARRLPVLARPVELRGCDGAHLPQRLDHRPRRLPRRGRRQRRRRDDVGRARPIDRPIPMDPLHWIGQLNLPGTQRCRLPRDLDEVLDVGAEDPGGSDVAGRATSSASGTRVRALYGTGVHPALQLCVRRHGVVVLNRAIGHARGNAPQDPPDAPKLSVSTETPVRHLLRERRRSRRW